MRSLFIAFEIDGSRTINDLFLLDREPGFFVWPSLLYLAALGLMAIGYSHRHNAQPKIRRSSAAFFDDYRFAPWVHIAVAACAAVGAAAFVLYVQRTGGSSFSVVSAKRTTIPGLELGSGYASYGTLTLVNDLSAFAFWLLLAHFAHSGVPHSLRTGRGLLLVLLFVNAAALPIYASTRADIAYLLVIAAAIELCTGNARPKSGTVILRSSLAILVTLSALTILRTSAQSDVPAVAETSVIAGSIGDALVYNRNFTDMATTSHIVQAVPDVLPYEYGETIVGWLAAPVPRAIWPEKPLISSGPVIGIKVFGNERAGVPPGFVGEMYWNFGIAGVLAGSWTFGLLLGRLYVRRSARLGSSPAATLVYCIVIFRLGGDALTAGVGYAAFNAAISAVILFVLLIVVKAPGGEPTTLGLRGGQSRGGQALAARSRLRVRPVDARPSNGSRLSNPKE